MFVIFGFRTRVKALARLLLICQVCSRPAAQTVYRKVRWFTLFFIPVIPFNRKHLLQCAMCGHVGVITKEDAERLVADANTAATPDAAAPDAATPDAAAPNAAAPVEPVANEQ